MTTEHTPTPWELAAAPKQGQLKQDILSEEGRSLFRTIYDLPMDEQLANAEFVCRAVNSFDAMKAALTNIRDCAHSPEQVHDSQSKILGRIESVANAALALAERGEK